MVHGGIKIRLIKFRIKKLFRGGDACALLREGNDAVDELHIRRNSASDWGEKIEKPLVFIDFQSIHAIFHCNSLQNRSSHKFSLEIPCILLRFFPTDPTFLEKMIFEIWLIIFFKPRKSLTKKTAQLNRSVHFINPMMGLNKCSYLKTYGK